jgi:hypothetical protein
MAEKGPAKASQMDWAACGLKASICRQEMSMWWIEIWQVSSNRGANDSPPVMDLVFLYMESFIIR